MMNSQNVPTTNENKSSNWNKMSSRPEHVDTDVVAEHHHVEKGHSNPRTNEVEVDVNKSWERAPQVQQTVPMVDNYSDFRKGKMEQDRFESTPSSSVRDELREQHEREYENERNLLVAKLEQEFFAEKERIKHEHEQQLQRELAECHKKEYEKEKENLKAEYEAELKERMNTLRLRHDKEFDQSLHQAKSKYDSEYEKARTALKEKHFREYQKAKEALARKHEQQYAQDREKIRGKYDLQIEKDKQNIKKVHEKELQKDVAQTEAQYAQQFEQGREKLKEKVTKEYVEENLGLNNDHATLIIEEQGYRPVQANLTINDNEKLKMQQLNQNLAEKNIKIEENDTFDIKSKDHYTGKEDDKIKVQAKSETGYAATPSTSENVSKSEVRKESKNPTDISSNTATTGNNVRIM